VKVDIITIFPGYFSPLGVSLLGKAAERGLIEFAVHDLRSWAHDVHRSVDDTPFGGGPGMVMSPVPWGEALDAVLGSGSPGTRLVVPTPAGVQFQQETAATYSRMAHLVFACGRYEGIDARFADEARARVPVDEVSVGDYVLSGGEPAVLVMIDAISRLLPGVQGEVKSHMLKSDMYKRDMVKSDMGQLLCFASGTGWLRCLGAVTAALMLGITVWLAPAGAQQPAPKKDKAPPPPAAQKAAPAAPAAAAPGAAPQSAWVKL